MKKLRLWIVLLILFAIAVTPIPLYMKDGGSRTLKAILWEYTDYHRIEDVNEMLVGPEVKILGVTVYDGTRVEPLK